MRDFWALAAASGLYSADTCGQLQDRFAALKGAEQQTSARALAEWLISTGAISRYQASVLLSGRPGPFVFGDFTIVERIDAGRLARSFRARFKDGRPVLLMFTASDHDADVGAAVERFEAAQSVHSPHVARVHHFIRSTTPSFFVLEDLHGQTLAERATAKLPPSDACRIAFQASLGLVAMHAAGVVHGQVCPRNLWIDSTSSVKLLQFPLVAPVAPNLRLQSPGVDYLAPELADPNHFPDVLSDLYGLGCTLFELIAGRVPFPGGTEADRLRRHRTEVAQRLDRLVEGVSEDLADVVAELLDKEPMLRAQTASHVAHLLSPFTSVVDQPRTARPPLDGRQLQAPGYGAWREPGWQEPPQQIPAQAAPVTAAPKPQPPEQKLIAPALPVASPAVNTIAGVRTVAKKTPGRPSSAAAATMPSNTMPARHAGTVESRADGPHASDTVAVMPEPDQPARKIEPSKIETGKIDAGDSEPLVSASAGAHGRNVAAPIQR